MLEITDRFLKLFQDFYVCFDKVFSHDFGKYIFDDFRMKKTGLHLIFVLKKWFSHDFGHKITFGDSHLIFTGKIFIWYMSISIWRLLDLQKIYIQKIYFQKFFGHFHVIFV